MSEIPSPHNEIKEIDRNGIIAQLKSARSHYNNLFQSILTGGQPMNLLLLKDMANMMPEEYVPKLARSETLSRLMQEQISTLGIGKYETSTFLDLMATAERNEEEITDEDLTFVREYINKIDQMCKNIMQEVFEGERFTMGKIAGSGENA